MAARADSHYWRASVVAGRRRLPMDLKTTIEELRINVAAWIGLFLSWSVLLAPALSFAQAQERRQ